MNPKTGIRLLTALLLFAATPALADKVFVELAAGPGIAQSDLSSFFELIRTSVGQLGHESVGEAKDAEMILKPKLLKLGGSYIATLDRVEKGKIVRSDQLKAARIEELDQVASRLTRAVLNGDTAKSDVRVGEVTEQEIHEGKNRKEARKGYYFGFGPVAQGNVNADFVSYAFTGAYAWDVNQAMVRLGSDVVFGGNALFADAHIGANFFLSDRDVAPYLGVKAGLGVSKANSGSSALDGEKVGGFLVGAEAGVQLLRTQSINLSIGGDWAIILNKNAIGNPVIMGGHLGLYF